MRDDFNLDEENNIEEEEFTNKDRFNNVLAYVPFLNIWLLFIEKQGAKEVNKKYTRQGIAIFLVYIVVFIVSTFIARKLSFILTIFYFVLVVFFGAKAYNGLYVEIGFIEEIMKQFENKTENDNKKDNNKK